MINPSGWGEGSIQRKVAANPGWYGKTQDKGQGNLVAGEGSGQETRQLTLVVWEGRAVGKKRGS
jgi:hypothetical protein